MSANEPTTRHTARNGHPAQLEIRFCRAVHANFPQFFRMKHHPQVPSANSPHYSDVPYENFAMTEEQCHGTLSLDTKTPILF